jgi:hypothetical protein
MTADGFAGMSRVGMPCLPPEQVKSNFTEVELGLTEEGAVCEGKRCFQCGVRLQIAPAPQPPPCNEGRIKELHEIKPAA